MRRAASGRARDAEARAIASSLAGSDIRLPTSSTRCVGERTASSRTIAAPAELPVGVVTALLGSPFFLAVLKTRQRELGAPQ